MGCLADDSKGESNAHTLVDRGPRALWNADNLH